VSDTPTPQNVRGPLGPSSAVVLATDATYFTRFEHVLHQGVPAGLCGLVRIYVLKSTSSVETGGRRGRQRRSGPLPDCGRRECDF
jgi:hypothetical protein